MKQIFLAILLSAISMTAPAQTSAKPATGTATRTTTSSSSAVKIPAGVPAVRGLVKTEFSLRYQEIKIGTGPAAQPNQIYKVLYTGWLAADGRKFDSSEDHRPPVMGPDGKPVMGPDGKPKLGDPQPLSFPQGFGRLIPGFDQGFDGMKVGGKRRLFIPWQLAYGARGRPGPDPAHPGIPPKSDLIFDVELVGVMDLQMPPGHPGVGAPGMPGRAPAGTAPPPPPPTEHPAAPAQPATPSQPAQPSAPPSSQPSTPPQPQQ